MSGPPERPFARDRSANGATDTLTEPSWQVAMVFVLLVVALQLIAGSRVRLSEWAVTADPYIGNHSMLEATAWREGRLDLEPIGPDPSLGKYRQRDTAWHDEKIYNVFPPLFTFFCSGAIALQEMQEQGPIENLYPPWYVAFVALPIPIVGFWAFRNVTGRSVSAALLTSYWILGTPLIKMLTDCRVGSQNEINHVLSNLGLMLIAGDLLGRRRIWPAALGLVIGMWSRQMTVLYLPALVWFAWTAAEHHKRQLATVAAAALVGIGALATLNHLKFGSALDSGYLSIYEGRDDLYARRGTEYGRVFDPRFIPRNAWHMMVSPPSIEFRGMLMRATGHPDGTAIWMTTPLFLLGLWYARRWWRDPPRRVLMLCSFAIILGLLSYHNSGSVQRGYYRFALDFLPVWLVVIGPYLFEERRGTWIMLGCLAWSALYFSILVQYTPIG